MRRARSPNRGEVAFQSYVHHDARARILPGCGTGPGKLVRSASRVEGAPDIPVTLVRLCWFGRTRHRTRVTENVPTSPWMLTSASCPCRNAGRILARSVMVHMTGRPTSPRSVIWPCAGVESATCRSSRGSLVHCGITAVHHAAGRALDMAVPLRTGILLLLDDRRHRGQVALAPRTRCTTAEHTQLVRRPYVGSDSGA